MNSIIINVDDSTDINTVYRQIKKLYPRFDIIKQNHEQFIKAMKKLNGSIDDSTFVEPEEIEYESPRENVI